MKAASIVFTDGATNWLADGFHRVTAYHNAEIEEIEAEVIQGTQRDAQWFSLGANKEHDAGGLKRRRIDIDRAIEKILFDEEWRTKSQETIAKHLGVSNATISRKFSSLTDVRDKKGITATRNGKSYEMNVSNIGKRRTNADKRKAVMTLLNDEEWSKWSDREIAEKCCVSNRFVSNVRPTSVNGSQITERKVERNGTVYTQNTSNIGKHYQAPDVNEKLVIVHTPGNCIA